MAMADVDVVDEKPEAASSPEAWGTLEELLLACAVNRYGADLWSSVAMELQKRIIRGNRKNSSPNAAFTPRVCEQRYDALKRRFDVTDDVGEHDLREELRRRRVEELRREVERHDFSIVSLELKVRKLEEERKKADLAIGPDPVQVEPVRLGSVSELRASAFELKRRSTIGGGELSSPVEGRIEDKSGPLIEFLENVRSHRHGRVFLHRLPSQETQKYKNLIRQHMDLDTIQSKLDSGVYSNSHPRFHRDLLLVFTNATLFFRKSSAEHLAARELRRLVTKEIAAHQAARKPKPALPFKPDLEPKKHLTSTDIVVCRRRRNSSGVRPLQLLSEHSKTDNKDEETENGVLRTKLSVDHKKKGGNNASNNKKKSNEDKKDEISDEEEQPINKRRKKMVSSRKEEVVNFLKRMKENSPSKEAVKAKARADNEGKHEERAKITDLSKKKVVIRKNIDTDGGGGKDDGAAKIRVFGRRSARGGTMAGGRGGGTSDSRRVKRRREGEVVGAATSTEKKKPRR